MKEYFEKMINIQAAQHQDKVRQFDITLLNDESLLKHKDLTQELRELGVWGLKNPSSFLEGVKRRDSFNILVGFRPSRFHAGHITLMRELGWLLQKGGEPIFVVAGIEASQQVGTEHAEAKVREFWGYLNEVNQFNFPTPQKVYSDTDSSELKALEELISRELKIRKVLQLYGWDHGESLYSLRKATMSAAAFLLPAYQDKKQGRDRSTVVLLDVNQVAHMEVSRIAARKLGLREPSFSFRSLLPSLSNMNKRMSIKDEKSLIFIDSDTVHAEGLLQRSQSGGRLTVEEQRGKGGRPEACSFFNVAGVFLDIRVRGEVYSHCVTGKNLCAECKQKAVPEVVKTLERINKTKVI